MGGGKGDAPDTPDYVGAAQEQGEQNRKSFLQGLNATRINQTGPFGSQTWQFTGQGVPERPTYEQFASRIGQPAAGSGGQLGGLAGAMRRGQSHTEAQARRDYEQALSDWETKSYTTPGAWSLNTTLSPGMDFKSFAAFDRLTSSLNLTSYSFLFSS